MRTKAERSNDEGSNDCHHHYESRDRQSFAWILLWRLWLSL